MSARLLDGKALAQTIRGEIAQAVAARVTTGQSIPGLATVLVGNRPESRGYVQGKRRACEKAGMRSWFHELPESTHTEELLALVNQLNQDPPVHGILVQLPLPPQIDEAAIIESIHPIKDVDSFHPDNVGRLMVGQPRYLPCTPYGVQQLLKRHQVDTTGQHVVVVGRSNIVGKPLAVMLMQKATPANPTGGNATVTVVHSKTRDLAEHTRRADILIAALGQPRFISPAMIKPGVIIVDVGTNRVDNTWVGDVHEDVAGLAAAMSPVPGGVGPMTITMLLHNTLKAAELQAGL